MRLKPRPVPRLSEYLVKVGVPRDVVEKVAHELYDVRLGEAGVERGAWTRSQFAEAMHLQAIDRGDFAEAMRWVGEMASAARTETTSAHVTVRGRLALVGGGGR